MELCGTPIFDSLVEETRRTRDGEDHSESNGKHADSDNENK